MAILDKVTVDIEIGGIGLAYTEGSDLLTLLRAANIIRDREWVTGEPLTLSYRGNELGGEAGEVCNKLKKLERERLGMVGTRATVEEVAAELADVIVCIDLIAMDLKIDLHQAIIDKFNASSEKMGLKTKIAQPDKLPDTQMDLGLSA